MSFLLDNQTKLSKKTLDNIKKYLELKKGGAINAAATALGTAVAAMGGYAVYTGSQELSNHQSQLEKIAKSLGDIDQLQNVKGVNAANVSDAIKANAVQIESILGKLSLELENINTKISKTQKETRKEQKDKRGNIYKRLNLLKITVDQNEIKRKENLKQIANVIKEIRKKIKLSEEMNLEKYDEIKNDLVGLNNKVIQGFSEVNGQINAINRELSSLDQKIENLKKEELALLENELQRKIGREEFNDTISVLSKVIDYNSEHVNKLIESQSKRLNSLENILVIQANRIQQNAEMITLNMLDMLAMDNQHKSDVSKLQNSIFNLDQKLEIETKKLKQELGGKISILEKELENQNQDIYVINEKLNNYAKFNEGLILLMFNEREFLLDRISENNKQIKQISQDNKQIKQQIQKDNNQIKQQIQKDKESISAISRIIEKLVIKQGEINSDRMKNIKNLNKRLQAEEEARKKQINKEKTIRKQQVSNINKRISKQQDDLSTTLDQLKYEISSISSEYEEQFKIQSDVNTKMVEAISNLHRKLKKTPFGVML